jgi:hypothetical protein
MSPNISFRESFSPKLFAKVQRRDCGAGRRRYDLDWPNDAVK